MRIIFAGRLNSFNKAIINKLSEEHEIIYCYFLEPDRFTFKSRWKLIRKRMKKYGLFKVINELLFHVYFRVFYAKNDYALKKNHFPADFLIDEEVKFNHSHVENINSEEWINHAKNLNPDIIFSVCGTVLFKKKFYTIPKLGTWVLHEGLTPEYKGLHTPLWAFLNNEPQFQGYTLLKVDDTIDGGLIVSQNNYDPQPFESWKTWSFTGHIAIISNMDKIMQDIRAFEVDQKFIVSDPSRKKGYYTWAGLSDVIKKQF
jgi:folate-dependent phosphoribosylglycinamide formyltransferase PurN